MDLTVSEVQAALKGWILITGLSSAGWTAHLHRPMCCEYYALHYSAASPSLTEAVSKVISLRNGAEN